MAITELLSSIETEYHVSGLEDLLQLPLKVCPEEVTAIIPSSVLAPDGVSLNALFLMTNNYLCEVRLSRDPQVFDFVRFSTITAWRCELRTQALSGADDNTITYDIACIRLNHDVGGGRLSSDLNYAGQERDAWLEMVLQTVPVSLLRG